jgi:ADP-ribose pyrophosphatase
METWISRETVFNGKLLRLDRGTVRLDDGREAQREVVVHPGGVAIVPVLGDTVVFVRQFRIAIGREVLEIPAGKFEPGDTPEHRARIELEEETGLSPGRLLPIGRMYPSVGFLTESLHLFLAFDLREVGPRPEWDERIEIVKMPIVEVRTRLKAYEFDDGKTRVGLHALLDHLDGR